MADDFSLPGHQAAEKAEGNLPLFGEELKQVAAVKHQESAIKVSDDATRIDHAIEERHRPHHVARKDQVKRSLSTVRGKQDNARLPDNQKVKSLTRLPGTKERIASGDVSKLPKRCKPLERRLSDIPENRFPCKELKNFFLMFVGHFSLRVKSDPHVRGH